MAELQVVFEADASRASRTIDLLKKAIKEVTKTFESAEISSENFVKAASNLSELKSELRNARNEVVDLDRAYQNLSRSIASFRSGMGAKGALPGVVSPVRGTPNQFGSPAYFEALNQSLAEAIDEGRRIDAEMERAARSRQDAITQFRTGMGARGAIPEIASPIRGGMAFPGSPAYVEEMAKAAREAQAALKNASQTAGTIAPPPQAFSPMSLAAFEIKLKQLKGEARLIAPDTRRWEELSREIIKTEHNIKRIQARQTGGPSAGQRLGAAGGAFLYGGGLGGGVGSALGGVTGGLVGGVSGAFGGAALGQLADNIGNALAATASFTAEIDKQRIALRNVTGSTQEYEQALAFIDKTSSKLAIPQEILNKSFTQLSASVIGAGGSVNEAEEAFLGIAAGIRGTGGSLSDMQGALLATSQVFSKGKVSAEELRQQIGERLPGAFTLFAQSIGKTPQELDKMLEQGQVGLNDFMLFVRTLSSTYGTTAEEIAASTQAAGDRMAVSMSRMREAVGRELQPVGAQFQAIFADFVQNQSPNFISAAQALAGALKPLLEALKATAENAESLAAGLAAFAAALAAAQLPAAIGAITLAVKGLTAAALANPFVALAAGIGLVTVAAVQGQQEINRYNDLIDGSAGSQDDLKVAIAKTAAELKQAEASMNGNGRMAEFAASKVDTLRNRLLALEGRYKAVIEIEQIFTGQRGVPAGYRKIDGRLAYQVPGAGWVDAETGSVIKQKTPGSPFPASTTAGGGGRARSNRSAERAAERAAQEKQRLAAIKAQLEEEIRIGNRLLEIDQQIALAKADQNEETLASLESDKRLLEIGTRAAKIRKDFEAGRIKQVEYTLRLQLLEIDRTKEQQRYEEDLNRIFRERFGLTDAITKASRQAREAAFGLGLGAGAFRTDINLMPGLTGGALGERRAETETELKELLKPANQLIEAADKIGSAFGEAFKGMVSGSMSAQQALASFFQSIGDYFLDMASRMIAKWLEMQIIGLAQSLLPGGSSIFPQGAGSFSGVFGSGGPAFNPATFTGGLSFATGGIAPGGFTAFANGGIVTGPTMGLVGEGRFNEAIVPLPDGRSIPVELGGAAGNQIVSNITVNVNNGQAQSDAGGGNSSELGRKLEGAVKQIIIGELRPGGVLSGRR
jgi:tape measure domain-containing protein